MEFNKMELAKTFSALSLKKFRYPQHCIRFNDRQTGRESGGPLATLKEVFDFFIANSKANYSPG